MLVHTQESFCNKEANDSKLRGISSWLLHKAETDTRTKQTMCADVRMILQPKHPELVISYNKIVLLKTQIVWQEFCRKHRAWAAAGLQQPQAAVTHTVTKLSIIKCLSHLIRHFPCNMYKSRPPQLHTGLTGSWQTEHSTKQSLLGRRCGEKHCVFSMHIMLWNGTIK